MKLWGLLVLFIVFSSVGVFADSSLTVYENKVGAGETIPLSISPSSTGMYKNVYLCKNGGLGYRYPCGIGKEYTGYAMAVQNLVFNSRASSWKFNVPRTVNFDIPYGIQEGDYFFAVYDYASRSYVRSNTFQVNVLDFPISVTCEQKRSFFHWGGCQPSYCAIRGMQRDPSRNCYNYRYRWYWWRWSYSVEYCVNTFVSDCEVGASCPFRLWNKYKAVSAEDCSENRDSDLGERKHLQGVTTGFDINDNYVDHEDFCINDTHVLEGVINDCVVELVPVECPNGCDSSLGQCVGESPSSWPNVGGREVVECD